VPGREQESGFFWGPHTPCGPFYLPRCVICRFAKAALRLLNTAKYRAVVFFPEMEFL
jgi:hypothetical protein